MRADSSSSKQEGASPSLIVIRLKDIGLSGISRQPLKPVGHVKATRRALCRFVLKEVQNGIENKWPTAPDGVKRFVAC